MPTHRQIKKVFLVGASSTIFLVALAYGVSPYWFAREFLGVSGLDHNLAHILRAMMGLYFGFGLFWLFAAFNDAYRGAALLTVGLFPAGLVVGRVLSFVVDGRPSTLLFVYMCFEFVQAPAAYWVFRLPDDDVR
jgi:hypothetical protein